MSYHTCNVFQTYSNENPPYPAASLGLSSITTNFIECIRDFFKKGLDLSGETGYERLLEPQSLFIIGTSRFSFSLNAGRPIKIHDPVTIPEDITITEKAFLSSDHIFAELQLNSVIVHKGQSVDLNYYVLYIKII